MVMNHEDITIIAQQAGEAAARTILRDTFRLLGVDIDDQAQVNEFRADLVHARRWRRLVDAVGRKAVLTIITSVLVLAGTLIWHGIKPGS